MLGTTVTFQTIFFCIRTTRDRKISFLSQAEDQYWLCRYSCVLMPSLRQTSCPVYTQKTWRKSSSDSKTYLKWPGLLLFAMSSLKTKKIPHPVLKWEATLYTVYLYSVLLIHSVLFTGKAQLLSFTTHLYRLIYWEYFHLIQYGTL